MREAGVLSRGFTLMEVMVTMMVFAAVMVGLAGFFLGTSGLSESSRHLTQAMADGRGVMEQMRNICQSNGLATVTATNWTAWAAANGLTSLTNEAVTVTYVNPVADPLSVAVLVSWQERRRARSATLNTLLTVR